MGSLFSAYPKIGGHFSRWHNFMFKLDNPELPKSHFSWTHQMADQPVIA